MRYFYADSNHSRLGPYTMAELRQLHLSGVVRAETLVTDETGAGAVLFKDLWAQPRSAPELAEPADDAKPPPLPGGRGGRRPEENSFADRAGEDLRAMAPHLLQPLAEWKTFRWLENRKALAIAGIGLLPLVFYAAFAQNGAMGNAFWAMALYFSGLWAVFFYYVFPVREAKFSTACLCFFGTGVVSLFLLLQLYKIWPLNAMFPWTDWRRDLLTRLLGCVLAVGVPEELCKALVLFVVVRRFAPLPPQAMLFYGLMAGLGFGIYEGVSYQTSRNFQVASSAVDYYLLNLIRLTTLPFLHAIWGGIAGYFIGFAAAYPARKRGLLLVAVGVPALLHGLYDTFSGGFLALVVALVSVLALNLYLAKSVEFEKLLAERPPPDQ